MFKLIKKILKLSFTLLFLFCIYGLVSGVIEHITLNKRLNEFINKAEVVLETEDIIYYEIPREDWMRQEKIYTIGNNTVGHNGDIMVTRVSPFQIPLVEQFIWTFIGGHAAIITDDGKKQIETQGNDPDGDNFVRKVHNDWFTYTGETFGLRIKDAKEEVYEKAVTKAEEYVSKRYPYNYTFIFNTTSSFYCTDMLSNVFKYAGHRINDDYLVTTVYDLIVSKNTYISYYAKQDNNGVRHIYYTN